MRIGMYISEKELMKYKKEEETIAVSHQSLPGYEEFYMYVEIHIDELMEIETKNYKEVERKNDGENFFKNVEYKVYSIKKTR